MIRSVIVCALISVMPVAAATELIVTQQNAPDFYRGYQRMTEHPHWVSLRIAVLCTMPRREDEVRERKITGVHYNTRVHIYANQPAAQVVAENAAVFSIGAVIVKEKLNEQGRISAVGGMIKRSPGYDAANGDWEYFYYGGEGEFANGRIKSCIDCHRSAKSKDYTYRVWYAPRQ